MSKESDDAEKEFLAALPARSFAHRLVDTKAARNLVNDQPSDYIVTSEGRMWYAEVKLCNDKVSFPFGNIRMGQKKAMSLQLRAKGEFFFHIKNGLTGRWYHIPAQLVLDTLTEGRKSLKWSEIDDYRYSYVDPKKCIAPL